MHDEIANIPIEKLVAPRLLLRLIDKQSVEYLEMRQSIRDRGLIGSLCVRPHPERPGMFEVVTGAHRLSCFQDLGWTGVPCIVKNLTDEEMLLLQIEENAVRVETQPVEFALHLQRLLKCRKGLTIAKLSRLVHKSQSWIRRVLTIADLVPEARKEVEWGKITLANAVILARLVPVLQTQYLDEARTMSKPDFDRFVAGVVKRFREDIKLGKMQRYYMTKFRPQPFYRPLKEVVEEIESLEGAAEVLVGERCKTYVDAWRAALKWAVHLDRRAVGVQRFLHARRQRRAFQKDGAGDAEADSSDDS